MSLSESSTIALTSPCGAEFSSGSSSGKRSTRRPASWKLSDWPIATRIQLLVLLGLTAFTVLASMHFLGVLSAREASVQTNALRQVVHDVGVISQELRSLRIASGRMAGMQAVDPEEVRDSVKNMSNALGSIHFAVADNVEFGALLNRLDNGANVIFPLYQTAQRNANEVGLTASTGLRGDMARRLTLLEAVSKDWPNMEAVVAKLQAVKRYEQPFLLSPGDEENGHLRKAMNELDFALFGVNLDATTRQQTSDAVREYLDLMANYQGAVHRRDTALHDLMELIVSLEDAAGESATQAMAGQYAADAELERSNQRNNVIITWGGGLALVIFMLFSLGVARSIYRPIRAIEHAMRDLAGGHSDTEIPGLERHDEIGSMSRSISVFKQTAQEMESLRAADKERRENAERQRQQELATIAEDFEHSVRGMTDLAKSTALRIYCDAAQMSEQAERAYGHGNYVAQLIKETSIVIQLVVDASHQLAESVSLVSHKLTDSEHAVERALDAAHGTNDRVTTLSSMAGQIDEAISLIQGITHQTNQLALNASIEAQRAGEAGRGFSVVAEEVKSLARRTAQATRQIAETISSVQREIHLTVRSVDTVQDEIFTLAQVADTVSTAMKLQTQVTGTIEERVTFASEHMMRIGGRSSELMSSMQLTAKAASELLEASNALNQISDRLHQETHQFQSSISSRAPVTVETLRGKQGTVLLAEDFDDEKDDDRDDERDVA